MVSKVYVAGYKPIPKKAEDPGYQQWSVAFAETVYGAATLDTKEIAESECRNLNSYKVTVPDGHVCHFEVEQLSSGKFAFVCQSHHL
jgi:hypothetical protein